MSERTKEVRNLCDSMRSECFRHSVKSNGPLLLCVVYVETKRGHEFKKEKKKEKRGGKEKVDKLQE